MLAFACLVASVQWPELKGNFRWPIGVGCGLCPGCAHLSVACYVVVKADGRVEKRCSPHYYTDNSHHKWIPDYFGQRYCVPARPVVDDKKYPDAWKTFQHSEIAALHDLFDTPNYASFTSWVDKAREFIRGLGDIRAVHVWIYNSRLAPCTKMEKNREPCHTVLGKLVDALKDEIVYFAIHVVVPDGRVFNYCSRSDDQMADDQGTAIPIEKWAFPFKGTSQTPLQTALHTQTRPLRLCRQIGTSSEGIIEDKIAYHGSCRRNSDVQCWHMHSLRCWISKCSNNSFVRYAARS